MIKKAYLKLDIDKETIFKIWAPTRLEAAKRLAERKKLTLKQFLNIYGIK